MKDNLDIVFDYKDNKHFNQDLNNLIKKSNNSHFEKWMFKEKDLDNFSPITVVNEKNEIIAALGVVKSDVYIGGEKCSAIQIGNFFIKDGHQDEDLESALLDAALSKYSNLVDILISYCGTDDEEFLIKSGFNRIQEYLFFIPWENENKFDENKVIKLDMDSLHDLEIVRDHIKHAGKQSDLLDTKGDSLVKFYNLNKYFSDDVYYIPSLETVVCYKFKNGILDLIGTFSTGKVDINQIIKTIAPKGTKKVLFGFIPTVKSGLLVTKTDSFIKTGKPIHSCLYLKEITTALENKKIVFPLLSRQK